MGTSAVQDDPAAAVAALKAQGAPDEAIHAYLEQKYGPAVTQADAAPVGGLIHQNAQKPGGMARLKANIADQNAAGAEHPAMEAGLQALETPMAGIPGGAFVESAARKLTNGGSLADSQNAVNKETSDIPYASAAGRLIGSASLTPLLPASGLKAGAILGGADQLANNDPTSGVGARLLRGTVGAGVGAGVGAVADRAITALRANLPTKLGGVPSASDQVLGLQDARTAANQSDVGPSYKTATDQGQRYYVDLANREDAVNQSINRGLAPAPKALPAPGQSAVARQEAQAGFQNHDFTNGPAPTLEHAAKNDYTATTPPTEPFHDSGLLQKDFTQEVPIKLRAANDVNVRQGPGDTAPTPSAAPTGPTGANAVSQALESPTVAPYAKLARSFEQNQGATDYQIAADIYRLMSEAQGKKLAITSNGDFAAAPAAQLQSLGIAKQRLRDAIGEVAPDFDAAVDQHRILSGELTANKQGYGLGQKILGTAPSAKQLGAPPKPNGLVPDPNVFLKRTLPSMTQPEAAQASRGLLGSVRQSGQGGSYNPFKAFGVLNSEPTNAAVRAIDAKAGNTLPSALQRALLAATQAEATP